MKDEALKKFMRRNKIESGQTRKLSCSISSQKLTKGYPFFYGEFDVLFILDPNHPHVLIDGLEKTDFCHSEFSTQYQTFEFKEEENILLIKGKSSIHGEYEISLKN